MRNRALLFAAGLLLSLSAVAQQVPTVLKDGQVIQLFKGKAPGSEALTQKEQTVKLDSHDIVVNVQLPSMTVVLPEAGKANGSSMLVCPGGGFVMLSWDTEGMMAARELAEQGITCFVLKYRLNPIVGEDGGAPKLPDDIMKNLLRYWALSAERSSAAAEGRKATVTEQALYTPSTQLAFDDAEQAMSIICQNAAKWGLDPAKVGIMGFSAGSIITINQVLSGKVHPAFAAPIYGGWLKNPVVPQDACPMFVCSPVNDIFMPEESLNIYLAWREAKKPVELHDYWATQHGFGAVKTGKAIDDWINAMVRFMKDVDFIK